MRFDWITFCRQRGIAFDTAGKNVTKGNITIHCPWCGAGDKSRHMGLSTDPRNPVWGCLRNARHRGRDPAYLIAKLLGISRPAAEGMVQASGPMLDDFESAVESLRQVDVAVRSETPTVLARPKEFRDLTVGPYGLKFIEYLATDRGFGDDVAELACDYELWYALTGPMAWRLIFPIRNARGVLVGWTGREIRQDAKVRYLTHDGRNEFYAPRRLHDTTSNLVLICEGPLDALKMDFYGWAFDMRAVSVLGLGQVKNCTDALRALPGQRVILFDADPIGVAHGLALANEIGARYVPLPTGVKDPGGMTPAQAQLFLGEIAEKGWTSTSTSV